MKLPSVDAFAEPDQAERRDEERDDEEQIDDIHVEPLARSEVSSRSIRRP
jgi:hypothetical protein